MPAPKYIPHYQAADYQQWEGDWELWKGIPIAMTPSPFGAHQRAVSRLAYLLWSAIEQQQCGECDVYVELDWRIEDDLIVRPDLSVCCGSKAKQFITSPPKLIIEVLSPSTCDKDRTAKFELYAQQQVRYYIMIDPVDLKHEGYELSSGGSYQPMNQTPLSLQLHPGCQIKLDLDRI